METNSSSYVKSDESTFLSNVLSKVCVLLSVIYWEIRILFMHFFWMFFLYNLSPLSPNILKKWIAVILK